MRAIKVYCPPGAEPPLYAFIDALDGKLKANASWITIVRNLTPVRKPLLPKTGY